MIEELPAKPSPLPDWCIPVCRLWVRRGTRGPFLSGKLGAAKILVLPNPDRRDENDAEWVVAFASAPPSVNA